ncbi:ComF family protein [Sediminibacillus halophilus]|uniref:Competence protein ComFC n=1 Tax=Sediminibacillus halophilus TaxID=482461 RepID=A0A1G9RD10_9BACI|nr:ComF family protein [Sediminibacillus halophilus]SDM21103.1 competence protein ComFC [Sediminibacillus halophilus]
MHCLWCDKEMVTEVHWGSLLLPDRVTYLCRECEAALEKLDGYLCNKCGRQVGRGGETCRDCRRWEQLSQWQGVLTQNRSVYVYNERMRVMLAKWKYRGDYKLREVFGIGLQDTFRKAFSKHLRKQAVLVPIPLSEERLYERGFNQSEAIIDVLGKPAEQLLTRTHGEKQSKKTRRQRIHTENPFTLIKPTDKPVILIDDIYTTGTTLRHAARTLKSHGCPEVYSLTLARS